MELPGIFQRQVGDGPIALSPIMLEGVGGDLDSMILEDTDGAICAERIDGMYVIRDLECGSQ